MVDERTIERRENVELAAKLYSDTNDGSMFWKYKPNKTKYKTVYVCHMADNSHGTLTLVNNDHDLSLTQGGVVLISPGRTILHHLWELVSDTHWEEISTKRRIMIDKLLEGCSQEK